MLKIKSVTGRNFLSIGAVSQSICLDSGDLTLILGENMDLGGNDSGSRNGVGKTVLLQMISYALFGTAINSIKRDNMINRTNAKGMTVTIDFSVDQIDYRVVRGRKPNVLKFFINNAEQVSSEDDSQGENRQTQSAIERVLRMSSTMFQHIIGLNSYTTPFLSLKAGDQREVIEQLLGITLLSEKADAIRELIRMTKEEIQREEYNIKSIDDSNKRITEQIDSLIRRQAMWRRQHEADLGELVAQYDKLSEIDIEQELLAHRDQTIYLEQVKKKQFFDDLKSRQMVWIKKQTADISGLEAQYTAINSIDIDSELAAHTALALWVQKSKDIDDLAKSIVRWGADERREAKLIEKLKAEIAELESHKCYACGQDFHDANHETVLKSKQDMLQEALLQAATTNRQMIEINDSLDALGELGVKPVTHYRTEAEAIRHSSEVENIRSKIASKETEVDPYADQLSGLQEVVLGVRPTTFYPTETQAIEHRSLVAGLEAQITKKVSESDPYTEQIAEMSATGIIEIDYTTINQLRTVLKHQDYLLDLLTNKKSFVRKKIIEQNLAHLNSRLSHYLDAIGLPHRVVFQNDLSVDITDMGRDCDFDSLSRGERNRVILSLSFAFRDVWETLYTPVNLIFIDELMDSGMDAAGVENGLILLKDFVRKRNKSVWLVSHRDELVSRVPSVLHVIKEGGFTSFRQGD